ncbi:MAG: hypothetical protein GXX88_01950, partial [Candidatus Hydrogenedentes bacterium]|nr:hypothetical protein [Candidatus Hydrogenedentota bacterium]
MILRPAAKKRGRPGGSFRPQEKRAGLAKWIPRKSRWALLASFLVLSAALSRYVESIPLALLEGMDYKALAPDAIQTDIAFDAPDPEATRLARAEASAKVPDTFRVNRELVQQQLAAFDRFAAGIQSQRKGMDAALREALLASDSSQRTEDLVWATAVARAQALTSGQDAPPDVLPEDVAVLLLPDRRSIPDREFEGQTEGGPAAQGQPPRPVTALKDKTPAAGSLSFTAADGLLEMTREALEYGLQFGILAPDARGTVLEGEKQPDIKIVRDSPMPDQARSEVFAPREIPKPDSSRNLLSIRLAQALQGDSSPAAELPVERSKA